MAIPPNMLKKVAAVPAGEPALSAAEAKGVLEIAALCVVADGNITTDEMDALAVLGGAIGTLGKKDVDALVQKSVALDGREARLERLGVVAKTLGSQGAKEVAYKCAVATALSDLAAADEEFEFDLDLQDALEMTPEVADRLTGEVHAALTPED